MNEPVTRSEVVRLIETHREPIPALDRYYLPELQANPAAPETGAVLYVIANNGAGKREARILFPTGAFQVVNTEP